MTHRDDLYLAGVWLTHEEATHALIDTYPKPKTTEEENVSATEILSKLRPGTRVRLKHPVDRYPHFLAPAGATGVVAYVESDAQPWTVAVRMDEPLEGAEEWDNEIHWYPTYDEASGHDDPLRDLEVI